jgi:hypothetical protein
MIHASLVIPSGTVMSFTKDVDLPLRRGSIGKRDRARVRAIILRRFTAEVGLRADQVVSATMRMLDSGHACSLGYGQFVGQGGPVALVRPAA